jgi:hypothetical protein
MDPDQVRDLRAQLGQWTEEDKAEVFDPIFLERAKDVLEKLAVAQNALGGGAETN